MGAAHATGLCGPINLGKQENTGTANGTAAQERRAGQSRALNMHAEEQEWEGKRHPLLSSLRHEARSASRLWGVQDEGFTVATQEGSREGTPGRMKSGKRTQRRERIACVCVYLRRRWMKEAGAGGTGRKGVLAGPGCVCLRVLWADGRVAAKVPNQWKGHSGKAQYKQGPRS